MKNLFVVCLLLLTGLVWATGDGEDSASGETLVIDFWTAPNQGQLDFWNKKVARFNQAGVRMDGKVVQVATQMMPEAPSSEAGIQNALATGTAPAASTNINRGFAATLSSSGRVYDLKSEPFFQDIVESRQMESVLPGWEIEGGQYVIPVYANAMGYHWNVKGLKALGFTNRVPETVADIEKLIRSFYELKDTTMKEMGIGHILMRPQLMHPEWWWDRWFDFQMQYEAFSGGGSWVTGNTLTLDKKTTEEVFEFFGTFGSTLQTAEDWNAFEQEKIPSIFQVTAPWDIAKYIAAGKVYGFDGDYVYGPPIVKNKGDIPYTFADSKGIVFYKGGNVTEEAHKGAVAFIRWVFTGEEGTNTDLDWIKITGQLPVRGDLLENPAFQAVIESNPAYGYQASAMSHAVPAMAHDKMAEIQEALGAKGLAPYIQENISSTSLKAGDAARHVDTAFEVMIEQGELQ